MVSFIACTVQLCVVSAVGVLLQYMSSLLYKPDSSLCFPQGYRFRHLVASVLSDPKQASTNKCSLQCISSFCVCIARLMSKRVCILRHSSIERLSLIPYRPVHDIYLPQWPFQGHFHPLSGISYLTQQRHLPTAVVNIQFHASELRQHGRFYIVQPATNFFASVPIVQ